MSIKARGRHYFSASGFPVTALRVSIAEGGRRSHPHDLTEHEHDHDFMELVIVVRGEAQQRLQGRTYPVSTGDVYILHNRSRHYFHDIRALELINVMYDPSRLPLPMDELRLLPGYSALFLLEPQYRRRHQFSSRLHLNPAGLEVAQRLAGDMMREIADGQPGRGVVLLARLLELMTFLAREYAGTRNRGARELLRIGDVISALGRDYARPWTLADMCRLAGMSRSTFVRTFHRALGQAPIDYLIERRLGAAMRLLRETDRPITDIALETGFSDSNYFARQFRRRTGTTPRAFRVGV